MVVASQVEANAYEGRDGEARASLDVTADQVIFLQGNGGAAQGSGGNSDNTAYYEGGGGAENIGDIPF